MKDLTSWDQLPLVMSVQDVTNVLGYGAYRIRELCQSNTIPCIRLGRAYKIPREALKEWVNRESMNDMRLFPAQFGHKHMQTSGNVIYAKKFSGRNA